jgi:hypothetical protein
MKSKDIIVGAKYKHRNYPNFEYLGCGITNRKNDKIKQKYLVILHTDKYWNGRIVLPIRNDDNGDIKFWNGFYLNS